MPIEVVFNAARRDGLATAEALQTMRANYDAAVEDWKQNSVTYHRYREFGTMPRGAAALMFDGDTYAGLEAKSLDADEMVWAREHLRILSGLYGLLRKLTVAWGVDPDGALHNELVSQQGDIDSTQVQQRSDTTINYPLVDIPTYAYYVTTCLNYAGHRLYSVRITYSEP